MQGDNKRKAEGDPAADEAPVAAAKGSKNNKKTKLAAVANAVDAQTAAATGAAEDDGGYVRLIPVPRTLLFVLSEDDAWRPVQLHPHDKAPSMTLSEENRTVSSAKGYRMARATHGTHEGAWYYEVRVTRLGPTGHVRLGWATRDAEVQAPVGYDQFSFGYRDKNGHKIYKGLREEYGVEFKEGDVVGCYLYLPPGGRALTRKKSDVTKQKGQYFFFEDEDNPPPKPLPGSLVAFSVNGVFQGVAYRDIVPEGTYYPAASIFTDPDQVEGAAVTFNFGPDFAHAFDPTQHGLPAASGAHELAGPPPPPPLTPDEIAQRHVLATNLLNHRMEEAAVAWSRAWVAGNMAAAKGLPQDPVASQALLSKLVEEVIQPAGHAAYKEMISGPKPFLPPEALAPSAFAAGLDDKGPEGYFLPKYRLSGVAQTAMSKELAAAFGLLDKGGAAAAGQPVANNN